VKVVVISASPRKNANTQIMMNFVFEYIKTKNSDTKFINLSKDDIECYKGPEHEYNSATRNATDDLMEADVWIIGTPIYNSFFSSALKNLFEYVNYKKTQGKIAGIAIMASGNIGFTFVQTLLTQLMSYFGVITNPKAVFLTTESISNDSIVDDDVKSRLRALADSTLGLASKVR
jgi:NAD(P)H-dependent FMN reductase